jgi:thymidylate kinase
MVNIISFEGADYSGKTSTVKYLSKIISNEDVVFNKGYIYPTLLTQKLLVLFYYSYINQLFIF